MLRAILLLGRSFALKSVFLRVAVFALYTSPKPPAWNRTFAALAFDLLPMPPRPAATAASIAMTTASISTGHMRLTVMPLFTCIVPPFLLTLWTDPISGGHVLLRSLAERDREPTRPDRPRSASRR